MKKDQSILQKFVIPNNYELFFKPNLENFTFQGKVKISIRIQKNTPVITLNSSELNITKAIITYKKKKIMASVNLIKFLDLIMLLPPGMKENNPERG